MLEEPDNSVAGDDIKASATVTPSNCVALQSLCGQRGTRFQLGFAPVPAPLSHP